MNPAINILTVVICLISFFIFAMFGAGSHGKMGLWDHGDSFFLYSLIYFGFVLIAGLRFWNFNKNGGSTTRRNIIVGLLGLLFFIGAIMLNSTYYEDLSSIPERVELTDYLKILLPMLLMMYWAFKLLTMKKNTP